jgi:IS5 family transposase
LKQFGKCYYSHIPLTIKNLYTRFSLERLDNNKAHFNADGTIPDTTVVVCRLFNVAAQMSRKKLLNYYLNQKLVAVPAEARKRAALEFATL